MQSEMSSLVFLQYLTTVFDNIKDGVILISIEPKDIYRLLVANEPYYRLTGHTKDQLGQPVEKIVAPDIYKKLVPRYRTVITSKQPLEYVSRHDLPAGEVILRIKFIPILNAVGEVIQIAGIIHDITEVEHLREKVKQTTDALTTINEDLQTT